jgi:hypothetical protein
LGSARGEGKGKEIRIVGESARGEVMADSINLIGNINFSLP